MKNQYLLLLGSIILGLVFIVSIANAETGRDSVSEYSFGGVDVPDPGITNGDTPSVAN